MRCLPLCLALIPAPLWAADIPLTSDVTSVTLYPQGATITREVPFEIPGGQHALILTDLPRSTPMDSLRVSVDGASMGSVTARTDYVPPSDPQINAALAAAKTLIEELEKELRIATNDISKTRLEADAAEARITFLEQIGNSEDLTKLGVDALRDMSAMIGQETLTAMQAALDARHRADTAERELKDLLEELAKARQAYDALVPETDERAYLSVAVEASGDTSGVMTVTYNNPAASWQPVYDLRLDRASGTLEIERGAFVSQATGENWTAVAMNLSTTRPSEQTEPSDLWSWLRRIAPQEATIRMKATSAPAATLEMSDAMLGGAVIAEEPEPYVATAEFDGLSVNYAFPTPVSVASGADEVRLTLGTLEASATIVAQAVPLHDDRAYLMAEFENDTGELILPTWSARYYLDGRYIGAPGIEMIASGAEASLSFGPIDGVQLTRRILDRNEGDTGVFSKSNLHSESVQIGVENLTGEAWPVRVLDRVPYSQQDELEISWTAAPRPTANNIDGKQGVMSWEFDLEPGKKTTIRLDHTIEWPEGQVLQ